MEYEHLSLHLGKHDTIRLEMRKPSQLTLYIDPFKLAEENQPRADILIITHPHFDHCSVEDIKRLLGPTTEIVTVPDCQSKLSFAHKQKVHLLRPTQSIMVKGITITGVAAYNTNKEFHPKENEWLGAIIDCAGIKVYVAGDTDLIDEMNSLGKIDIAFLPVSGTYVMNAQEAVEAAKRIKPKVAIPMHYAEIVGTIQDAKTFVEGAATFTKAVIIGEQ